MTQARPKRGTVPAEFTDAARGIRLQKVLAEAGVASRRDCESLITAGRDSNRRSIRASSSVGSRISESGCNASQSPSGIGDGSWRKGIDSPRRSPATASNVESLIGYQTDSVSRS